MITIDQTGMVQAFVSGAFPALSWVNLKEAMGDLGIFIVTEIRKLSLSDIEELTSSQNQGHRFLQCPKLIQ